MKLRTWPLTLVLLALLGLTIFGCQGSTNPVEPPSVPLRTTENGDPDPIPCGDITTSDLLAGQTIVAGSVSIFNDEDYLYVVYETTGDWEIIETHVWVGTSVDGYPQNGSGNPKIGHFPYANDHDPAVTEFTYMIDLDDGPWEVGDTLYVMAHAVVVIFDEFGEIIDNETAWAACHELTTSKRWAYYCDHVVQECCCELDIYNDLIEACLSYPGPNSYWQTTLVGVPAGYDVEDGIPYLGWCVQQTVYITQGCHDVNLWSSTDPSLPGHLQDDDWDMVNYLINHKDDCQNGNLTKFDIQAAIWYFVDSGTYPSDPEAQCLVDEALANGEGYCPKAGELTAVIVDAGPSKQRTFIEVECE